VPELSLRAEVVYYLKTSTAPTQGRQYSFARALSIVPGHTDALVPASSGVLQY